MEILNVQHLCKTYGSGENRVEALKDVSFMLQKGEFAAVVGESGSGKSTLLHCIGALDTPTAGTVLVDGQNLFASWCRNWMWSRTSFFRCCWITAAPTPLQWRNCWPCWA